MANPEHLAVAQKGAAAIAEWRESHPESALGGLDLTWANLSLANLSEAILTGADLSKAICYYAVFGDCDLSLAEGLDEIVHAGPSTIGVDTIISTAQSAVGGGGRLSPEVRGFFTGAGVPEAALDAMVAPIWKRKYHSCFISYGSPDLEFATKLERDLREKGVSCWKFDTDAVPGRPLGGEIRKGRREAEKFVVTCSVKSLIRPPVTKEIEEQVDEDPNKIIPVSLDNIWTEPGFRVHGPTKDLKDFLLNNVWASFAGWEKDPKRYQEGLERLLKGLERGEAQ